MQAVQSFEELHAQSLPVIIHPWPLVSGDIFLKVANKNVSEGRSQLRAHGDTINLPKHCSIEQELNRGHGESYKLWAYELFNPIPTRLFFVFQKPRGGGGHIVPPPPPCKNPVTFLRIQSSKVYRKACLIPMQTWVFWHNFGFHGKDGSVSDFFWGTSY